MANSESLEFQSEIHRPDVSTRGAVAVRAPHPVEALQKAAGNRAVADLLRPREYAGSGGAAVDSKCVNGISEAAGLFDDKDPPSKDAPKDAPKSPAKKKRAGVDSFVVKWTENPDNSPKTAKLLLTYKVKLKKDADFDPAAAEFRQNAFHVFEVAAGTHKGEKDDNSPIHDDHYSRADDTGGHTKDDVDFESNDNPGPKENALAADDDIRYTFTAEQLIIDTTDGNKEIAKRGPHTATVSGADPRTFKDVPKTLS